MSTVVGLVTSWGLFLYLVRRAAPGIRHDLDRLARWTGLRTRTRAEVGVEAEAPAPSPTYPGAIEPEPGTASGGCSGTGAARRPARTPLARARKSRGVSHAAGR